MCLVLVDPGVDRSTGPLVMIQCQGRPPASSQPRRLSYLMNFSITSSTHICRRRKLMP